jgi:hypothetical protein
MHLRRVLKVGKVGSIQEHVQTQQYGFLPCLQPSSLTGEGNLLSDVVVTVPCLYYYIVEEAIIH